MFRFTLVALLLLTTPALAGPAEDAYVASRDKAITALNRKGIKPEQQTQREKAALADLTKQMQAIVGPYAVNGFQRAGKINLETLIKELGFGMLDGMSYTNDADTARFVVTTPDLFQRWVQGLSKTWAKIADPAQLVAQALKSDDIYTRAIINDAAVLSFTEIPLRKPEGSIAFASLTAQTQDDAALLKPAQVVVAAKAGERIVLASLNVHGEAPDIAACDAVYKAGEARANALYEKYRASGLKDQKVFDQYTKAQTEGSAAHRRCYGERIRNTPYFAAATAQAQAFLDALPR